MYFVVAFHILKVKSLSFLRWKMGQIHFHPSPRVLLCQFHEKKSWKLKWTIMIGEQPLCDFDGVYLCMNHERCCRCSVSDCLQPLGLQHHRLPCPPLSPGVFSNSYSLSWWCHPTISSSVTPICSYPQSFQASGSFPMNWFFTSDGQSIGMR